MAVSPRDEPIASAFSAVSMHTLPARLEARGWGWRHGTRRAWALENIDLLIEPGERVLLLGASGAGKSTLLHGLAGVLGGEEEGDERGTLDIDGRPAADQRGRAGLVLQDPDAQVMLARVGDDVAFGCENLAVPAPDIWPRVDDALAAVGLDLPREHPTEALSGGQKQRLALAGVVAMQPGALLLDEPTANLDPAGVLEVRDAVAHVLESTGATLVVIEHRIDAWLPLIDRVVVLGQGGVLADGPPADVLADRAEELTAAGVWVPGRRVANPRTRSSASGEVLLRGRGLALRRPGGPIVQEGLDLDIHAGECLAVVGANGAGKSTLALILAGLIPPAEGTLHASEVLRGDARGTEPIRWPSRALLTRLGTVFQDPDHQFLARTVHEELAVGLNALGLGEGEREHRIAEVLERLRLTELARANPFTLSGGQKRRLSVATVLVTGPQIIVLDEPTFGQDANTWAALVELCRELVDDGRTLVAVSHDEEFIDAIADRRLSLVPRVSGGVA